MFFSNDKEKGFSSEPDITVFGGYLKGPILFQVSIHFTNYFIIYILSSLLWCTHFLLLLWGVQRCYNGLQIFELQTLFLVSFILFLVNYVFDGLEDVIICLILLQATRLCKFRAAFQFVFPFYTCIIPYIYMCIFSREARIFCCLVLFAFTFWFGHTFLYLCCTFVLLCVFSYSLVFRTYNFTWYFIS